MKKAKILSILSIITILTNIIFPILSSEVYAEGVNVDTTVVEHYTDVNITDDITLEKDKEFIIDFTKTDNLSKGLSYLADFGNTVYYKVVDNKLEFTENESEAVIKIVGNESENKAVMTLINTDDNKSYNLDFSCRRLDRSTLTYNGIEYGDGTIFVGDMPEDYEPSETGSATIKQTRDDYYTRYNFKCKLNLIVNATQDIEVEGSYNGFGMEISLNGVKVGAESANVTGTAKGYTTGSIKNKIVIQLSYGDGNIGSVTINGTNMTLPDGTQDRAEFGVDPASKYTIVVTKSQSTSNVPKTIIWDSDKTNNPNIKDNELLKNGTIEILDIKDQNGNSVGLDNVNQDLEKNNGWASIIPGSKVILKLKPDYGYQLTEISINEERLVAGKEQSTFEYIMPNTNVHISGIFEKVDDKVNAESDKVKSGTIELGGEEIDSGSVVLSVNDVTLTKEQISNFEEKANGYEISSYLDINLDQVIYKGSATDVWTNELKELNNEATITLQLEEGVNGNEVVIVHEKHDGTYEIIPTTYDPETNTITFKTSSFSNYAIASKTVAVNTDTISTNPQTGDNIIMFIIIFALALTGILGIFIINKKKVKNNK
ncbi:MAG: LPXTG cell wall anchor domain-containing protein [Bacilli bacterium]